MTASTFMVPASIGRRIIGVSMTPGGMVFTVTAAISLWARGSRASALVKAMTPPLEAT